MSEKILFTVSCTCQNCAHTFKYGVTETKRDAVCTHCSFTQVPKKLDGFPTIGYSYQTKKMSENMKDRFREIAKEVPTAAAKASITQHI